MEPVWRAKPSRFCALLFAAALPLGGCSLTDILTGVDTNYTIERSEEDAPASDYLQTILDERIRDNTETLSDVEETRARQEDYLEQTVRADLVKALRAKGYYEAEVTYRDGDAPFTGAYDISYGPKYSLGSIDVLPEEFQRHLQDTALREGLALDAELVLRAQGTLRDNIQKNRCYFSLDVKNEVYLNRGADTGDLDFVVAARREGNFGPVVFKGNERVHESYLRKLVPWKEGDCFRREKLEDYKATLLQSGLFARAEAELPDEPAPDGTVPVTLELRERAHRTVRAGLTYYSDEGPGAIFGWEHRNIFGAAETLEAELALSALKQSLDLDFRKPYFMRKDQDLALNAALRRQDTDAFEELGFDLGGAVERRFTDHLSASTGLDFTLTQITDHAEDDGEEQDARTFALLSAPQSLTYDNRDNALDPHKGVNLAASGEPFFDVLGEASPFFKTEFSGSYYLAFGTPADIVLATRAGIGSLWGAEVGDIPATERFYAGGGGSVRGFGYQEVGPKDDNGEPTGGRSLASFSLELRSKFSDNIGSAVFVDGASVSENSAPAFSDVAIGAGVGLRYYTSFGPIRFDVATPLTQKEGPERNYQFYISIGQAF